MYRKRLKVHNGCQRCRIRKKKCDEQRPKCSFCERWNLDCVWPTQDKSSWEAIDRIPKTLSRGDAGNLIIANPGTSAFDPFHKLPVADRDHNNNQLISSLRMLFTGMISSSIPFDLLSIQRDLAHDFARSIFEDTAICYALGAYCMNLQSKKVPTPVRNNRALVYETRAVSALRERLQQERLPSHGTLFTAGAHFVSFALRNPGPTELCRLSDGIGQMVKAHGGYLSLSKHLSLGTRVALHVCDTLTSLFSATKPSYVVVLRPERPQSLDLMYKCTIAPGPTFLENKCEPMLMSTIWDMDFILFFRKPSKQTRSLSPVEESYLFQLLQYVDICICQLQAQYIGTKSPDEIIILSMIMITMETFAESYNHIFVVEAVLNRLQRALTTVYTHDNGLDEEVGIWACLTALVGSSLEKQRQWFLDFIPCLLNERYGSPCWPKFWQEDIGEKLSRMLWHDRLQKRYQEFCDSIRSNNQNVR